VNSHRLSERRASGRRSKVKNVRLIDAVAAATLNDRVDNRTAFSGVGVSEEQPVLFFRGRLAGSRFRPGCCRFQSVDPGDKPAATPTGPERSGWPCPLCFEAVSSAYSCGAAAALEPKSSLPRSLLILFWNHPWSRWHKTATPKPPFAIAIKDGQPIRLCRALGGKIPNLRSGCAPAQLSPANLISFGVLVESILCPQRRFGDSTSSFSYCPKWKCDDVSVSAITKSE
jgi:hypothetical protein